MSNVGLVIAAAGAGQRMGYDREKALIPILGRPMLTWTLLAFDRIHEIVERVVVVPPGRKDAFRTEVLEPLKLERNVELVDGGPRRQDSVMCGLKALTGKTRWVLVHDAARPLVSAGLIRRILGVLREGEAVVPALTPRDSLARVGFETWIKSYEDRTRMLAVQTPQGFHLQVLEYAFEQAEKDEFKGTDEAALVLRANHPVSWIEGEVENLKITYPSDVAVAELILEGRRQEGGEDG